MGGRLAKLQVETETEDIRIPSIFRVLINKSEAIVLLIKALIMVARKRFRKRIVFSRKATTMQVSLRRVRKRKLAIFTKRVSNIS